MLKRFKLKGLVLADEETVAVDGQRADRRAIPICCRWRLSGTAVLQQLFRCIGRPVGHAAPLRARHLAPIGDRIAGGDVSISPYRLGGKTPCQFCDYKPVCQFDPLIEGNEYNKLQKAGKDEVWQTAARPRMTKRRTTRSQRIARAPRNVPGRGRKHDDK